TTNNTQKPKTSISPLFLNMTAKEKKKISKQPSYEEFLQLCKDADNLIQDLLKGPSRLQGKRPSNLKSAAIWYLARQRKLNVTLNDLYHIYKSYQEALIEIHKIIKKEASQQQTQE
ncbi:unnamed protein product, partial [marine sediment metagenome]